MKFVFLIFVFWGSVSIEGIPKNYEQRIESRSVGDLPVINWFYGNHPDHNESGENKELIKIIPLDEAGLTDEPEPIENFIDELKEKAKETDNKDGATMHLLTDLKETLNETSTKLAKVFVNGAWRIFDIGTLGTSRRTRNVEEVSYLLAPFYAFIALLNQLLHGIQLGSNAQRGSIFDLFLPLTYLSKGLFGSSPQIHQKLIHEIVNSRGAEQNHAPNPIQRPSVSVVFVIDNRTKENANRLLNGKTPSEVLSKVKYYLDKDDLDSEEKLYIVWKLYDLYFDISENDDGTNLKLIRMITRVDEDPRFDELFEILKAKDDPEFTKIWKLFKKSHSKLNKNYLSIIRNLPEGKIIQHPSQHCFVIVPSHDFKIKKRKKLSGFESDDENHKLATTDLESNEEYHICCIDDKNEIKANHFLGDGSNDEVFSKIKKYCDKEELDPGNEWYIVLKLYNMIKNLDKNDTDKSKIIPLITQIGKDSKFEKIFENIKTKKDPRFEEMSKLFKSDPKDLEEIIKSLKKKEPEKKEDSKPDSSKDPSLNKTTENKSAEDEKEQKKLQEEKEQKKLQDEKEQKKLQDEKELKKDDVIIKPADPPKTQNTETIEKSSSTSSDPSKATISEFKSLEPSMKLSWFHDPGQERNARIIKDKVHYYTTKAGVAYSDLEEVENLLKDPSLDKDSKQDLITYVNKWYGTFVRNEHVKHKFDDLVHIIRVNPEYNNFFETLHPGREEPRDDKELKTLLKPPGMIKPEPKEEKPPSMISRVTQEYNIRLMKDKVRRLSLKTEVLYEDLKEVENLLNDPTLDLDSKYDLITFVHKWYGSFVRNEKMKNKFDELVHLINHVGGLTGEDLDRFLTNTENLLQLRNPALDSKNRDNLIKMMYSWHKIQNLDERIKKRIGEIIGKLEENPDNHPYLEIKRG